MQKLNIRYLTKSVPNTQRQRLRLWWRGVMDAAREVPPETHLEWFQVKEGDPGYEEATWSFNVVEGPRYEIKNGEWKQVHAET